jgi:hypothetical protein
MYDCCNNLEHRSAVFENREPVRIFGLKESKLQNDGNKIHNEGIYSSPKLLRNQLILVYLTRGVSWRKHCYYFWKSSFSNCSLVWNLNYANMSYYICMIIGGQDRIQCCNIYASGLETDREVTIIVRPLEDNNSPCIIKEMRC